MPRSYRPTGAGLKSSDRAAAVHAARTEACGPGRGDDASCHVSESRIQSHMPSKSTCGTSGGKKSTG